jgi:hypothetical protein
MRVFILGGQSNMVGFAKSEDLPDELAGTRQHVVIFEQGRWQPLSPKERFGPEISFADELASAYPSETIGLIKYAVSGTSLLAWAPDWVEEEARKTQNAGAGPLYRNLMDLVSAARAQSAFEIVGMMWMQGERDARFPAVAPDYEKNLKSFIRRIRADFGVRELPFILARVNPPADRWLGLSDVRTAQERVAREDPFVVMISTDDLSKLPDNVHYDADGLVELGRRFARAYMTSVATPRPSAEK